MRRRHPIVVSVIALCLALSGHLNPAIAGGLIPTERLLAPSANSTAQEQRMQLQSALTAAGVDGGLARQRLDMLSDAEVARLAVDLHTAPAGGVWFMPFLLVAAVIGVLISTGRNAEGPRILPATDLFGRPMNIAGAP